MSSNDKIETITISLPDLEPLAYEWSDNMNVGAIGASTIDLSTVTVTSQTQITSIGTSIGSNGVWSSTASVIGGTGSSITFTDPYEEMEKRLKRVEEIIEEEKRIRDEHPAVKNAYDEYRLLLVLAKPHANDLLTDE